MCTYVCQYTPPSPVHTINGRPVILYMMYFFPISWKFGHHKILQAYHIFYSFCASPRKKLVATAPNENLKIDFSINLNKYFWKVIYTFKVALLFQKISTHCKADLRHVVAMPLHQTYCLTCFYSCIKFYCPKLRLSWVLLAKKVLFHMMNSWYCLEYVFSSLKLQVHQRKFENLPTCSCSYKNTNLKISHS